MHSYHKAATLAANHMTQFRRQAILLFYAACALASLLLFSCSGGNKAAADTAAADSVLPADTVVAEPAELFITAEGVGPVTIGMRTGDIQPSMEDLYDFVSSEDGYDGSNAYIFVRGENPLFTAYEFTEGTIDVISAESPLVAVETPDGGTLHLGDEFAGVLTLPGVEAEWENADGDGMWCWRWQGLWFQPDQSRLPEDLARELYSDVAPPALTTFTPDVRIGYIGTGLPW